MAANVGTVDRLLRALIGIVLLWLAFGSGMALFDQPIVKYGAALIGVVMLIVAVVRVCPIYAIFGWRTCRA